MTATRSASSQRDLTWVVALAACFWGTSALLREPLAQVLDAATIVMYEHLVLVLLLLPWLVPALRRWSEAPPRVRVGAVVIGAGSSALATTLFTAAFRLGDPITPQILQKLQPLIAILLAAVILGERLRPRFWWFAVPALAGAWLMTFPEPFSVRVGDATAALLAIGAATLWGAGTVLGRLVDGHLGPRDTLALRFGFGLPAAAVIVAVSDAGWTMPMDRVPQLVLLALIPGALALGLYYIGLRRTAASRATLAELMFPVTSVLVGVTLMDTTLTWSRWLGVLIVVAAVTGLALHEARAARTGVVEADLYRNPEPSPRV
ncbi:DMT family transporter [Ornithinimicrobium sp. F0845]|uniref:DMT family transporter n=1 Tax=Ornithinimicrobium sp. F0845 TaxID=2926412 RepID=UPI001FF6C4C0|nr:DMT family transporter [Ornithinimicrobium sp. F0845]